MGRSLFLCSVIRQTKKGQKRGALLSFLLYDRLRERDTDCVAERKRIKQQLARGRAVHAGASGGVVGELVAVA